MCVYSPQPNFYSVVFLALLASFPLKANSAHGTRDRYFVGKERRKFWRLGSRSVLRMRQREVSRTVREALSLPPHLHDHLLSSLDETVLCLKCQPVFFACGWLVLIQASKNTDSQRKWEVHLQWSALRRLWSLEQPALTILVDSCGGLRACKFGWDTADAAPYPTGLAQIVSDYFPIPHARRILALFFFTSNRKISLAHEHTGDFKEW